MTERKKSIKKLVSVLVSLTLLLGFLGPASEALAGLEDGDSANENLEDSSDIKSMELQSENTNIITGSEYINETTRAEDNNIVIDGGSLYINNSTLILSLDEEHTWNITVKNGGRLDLWNSTIKTSTNSTSSLRPFLKTDITVTDASTISLKRNSSLRFPGFVNILGSTLKMKNSTFDKLKDDDIPKYDYLWDGIDNDANKDHDDNDDAPRLNVKNSDVYMENSEIDNYYSNTDMPKTNDQSSDEMTWYPLDEATEEPIEEFQDVSDENYVLNESETKSLNDWYLYNPMVPHEHIGDYPYINPTNRISSLYVEITYTPEENYTREDAPKGNITYYSPREEEYVKAMDLDNTSTTSETRATEIWEIDLSEFYKGERNGTTRLLHDLQLNITNPENPNTDDLTSISVSELRLVSAYDNDIYVEDSNFTAIDSYIDVDYKTSDIDPRDGNETITNSSTYLQDSNLEHSVLRLYDSEFKSYGLEVSDEKPTDGTEYGDPWILNNWDSNNNTWLYRWVELQITNQDGVPLPGATVDTEYNPLGEDQALSDRVQEANSLHNNSEAWDHMNRTAPGYYDAENDTFVANEDGEVTFFLASDRINYPKDWPNSEFVGHYKLNITYTDESQDIFASDIQQLDMPDKFPGIHNPHGFDLNVDVDLADLKAETLMFTKDGETKDYVANETEGKLKMNVSNIGDRTAKNFSVSFYENEVDQGNLIESKEIESLDDGNNTWETITWTPNEIGEYDLIGVVDSDDDVIEKNETNNKDNFTLTVGEKPDLTVESIDVEPEVMKTDEAEITATIGNQGGPVASESEVTVEFYQNYTENQTRILIDEILVPANNIPTQMDPVLWNTTDLQVGDYNITVEIDPDNKIDELNEENNTQTISSSVLTQPDLTPIDLSVPNNARIGEEIQITVNVTNNGQWISESTTVYFMVDGTQLTTRSIPPLGEGDSEEITVNWLAEMTNDQVTQKRNIMVEIEPIENEGNQNNLTTSSEITVERHLDLTVDDLDVQFDVDPGTPAGVPEGKTIEVSGIVANTGDLDVTNFTAQLLVDGNVVMSETGDELGINDDMTITFVWNSNLSSSDLESEERTLKFNVTSEAEVAAGGGTEVVEDRHLENNSMSESLMIHKAPDLTPIDFNVSPNTARVGESVDVTFSVANQGVWPSDEITAQVLVDDEGAFETINIPGLNGGSTSAEISIEWTADMIEGMENQTREITVAVLSDPNEGNFDNLTKSESVLVERYLDLTVDDLDVQFDVDDTALEGVPEGKNVQVTGIVANTGDLDVTNFTAQLLVDGNVAIEETGYELGIDETTTITFDWNSQLSSSDLESEERTLTFNVNSEAEVAAGGGTVVDDEYPADNSISESLMIHKAPDLTLVNLEVSPDTVRVGEDVDVTFNLKNQGVWPSDEITAQVSVDDEEPFDTITIAGLSGGTTSEEISVEWTADMIEGEEDKIREISVLVLPDPNEGDFDNLEISTDITVERHNEFSINELQVTPDELTEGEEVHIDTAIENIGDLDVERYDVELFIDEQFNKSKEVKNLTRGQTGSVEFTWNSSLSDKITEDEKEEDRTVEIRINEAKAQQTVKIKRKPNLKFISQNWSSDGEDLNTSGGMDLTELDSLAFQGMIRNEGGTQINGSVVNFKFPNKVVTRTVNASADETRNVSAEWTVEDVSGSIHVWVNSTKDPQTATTYDEIIIQDVNVETMDVLLTEREIPEDIQPGKEYEFSAVVKRDKGDKPVGGRGVTVQIKEPSGKVLKEATATTGDDGEFSVYLRMPDEGGDYKVVYDISDTQLQQDTYSLSVESEVQGLMGIPWWIIALAVAAAAGGAGSFIAYRQFFGEREIVECGNCGATISADATSCPKCGVEFDTETVKCSECDEWIPADSKECPECGAEFIKTGTEVEDYTERMRKQFRKFVNKQKRKAEEELGRELSKKEFMDWWKDQPSFVTFGEWVERKEAQRKEGSKECPECGTLNSVDDAICQKCGASLIELGKPPEEESEKDFEEELSEEISEDLDNISEIEEESEEMQEETPESSDISEDLEEESEEEEELGEPEKEEKQKPKRKKKKVKKKVVKKPPEEESEEEAEEE